MNNSQKIDTTQKLCDLCNSGEQKFLFSEMEFSVVKCKKCGLVYTSPQPDQEEIKGYYTKRHESLKTLCPSKVEEGLCSERLKALQKYKNAGRLLDYGCGISKFLSLTLKAGFDSYGFDLEEDSINVCKKNKIPTLTEDEIKDSSFDIITLSQVLEHIPNPKDKLKWLRKKLTKGGIILIEVPNINSLNSRLQGKNWFYIKIPYHLTYFSMTTLAKMLETVGFKIGKKEWIGSFLLGMFTQKMHEGGWSKNDEKKLHRFYNLLRPLVRLNYCLARLFRVGDHIRIIAKRIEK